MSVRPNISGNTVVGQGRAVLAAGRGWGLFGFFLFNYRLLCLPFLSPYLSGDDSIQTKMVSHRAIKPQKYSNKLRKYLFEPPPPPFPLKTHLITTKKINETVRINHKHYQFWSELTNKGNRCLISFSIV